MNKQDIETAQRNLDETTQQWFDALIELIEAHERHNKEFNPVEKVS
jgi:hypothetical protein